MMDVLLITTCLLAIIGALYALFAKHLMRGVLGLAVFFAALAGLFAQMGAWYVAVGQLFLFVGGVVTLFVLAFNFTKTPLQSEGGMLGVALMLVMLAAFGLFLPEIGPAQSVPFGEFALVFFTQYGWIVNIALLLAFASLLGAQYLMEDT
jgi:NADH:ubiquinone oxidoreductase subunit 6 (subunit J)